MGLKFKLSEFGFFIWVVSKPTGLPRRWHLMSLEIISCGAETTTNFVTSILLNMSRENWGKEAETAKCKVIYVSLVLSFCPQSVGIDFIFSGHLTTWPAFFWACAVGFFSRLIVRLLRWCDWREASFASGFASVPLDRDHDLLLQLHQTSPSNNKGRIQVCCAI